MKITIKKRTYTITADDRFMDNGRGLTLLTQGTCPRLTKQAEKEISSAKRIRTGGGYTRNISTFSLDI